VAIRFAESKEDKNNGGYKKMGYLKYVKMAFRKPTAEVKAVQRERLIQMRREPVTTRLEAPTRMDRARSLGYKAKPGVLVIRQRVLRGGHTRPQVAGGRRPKRSGTRKNLAKNYQQIAEEKAAREYHNCEVVGSYYVAQDGKYRWFEVIMVDRTHPQVIADKNLIGIAAQRNRAGRGLTSAGRKGRGIRSHKGIGAEKLRPSLRSNNRLH
jgi:large subunit ribosomal protein L15e